MCHSDILLMIQRPLLWRTQWKGNSYLRYRAVYIRGQIYFQKLQCFFRERQLQHDECIVLDKNILIVQTLQNYCPQKGVNITRSESLPVHGLQTASQFCSIQAPSQGLTPGSEQS